jgi:hypothetical protein
LNVSEAFDDLTKAIELAGTVQKKTLSQALCQRGTLHRRESRFELAREDFEIAAQMGNQFAKSQVGTFLELFVFVTLFFSVGRTEPLRRPLQPNAAKSYGHVVIT